MRFAAWLAAGAALVALPALAETRDAAAARAAATEAQMTDEERGRLVLGHLFQLAESLGLEDGVRTGAGIVQGVPRLGVPPLRETDASLGVTWVGGARGNGGTQLPSGTAQGATWSPELIERGGAMIGSEARAKGYNVMLAGGINLMRDPRNGRTFEYIGEDPLLAGTLGGASVRGIQSNDIVSTLKHYAINPQETGRAFMNVVIDEGSLRESDLLAFEIAIEQGDPGAIMCAYNALNGPQSCGSEFLLDQVLKRDWGFRGFTMSDWGAVDAVDYALKGLDQQSGSQIDPERFFGEPLLEAARADPAYKARLRDMARRVLWAIYDNGLDAHPVEIGPVDSAANGEVALEVARQGIVLLRNEDGILPLGTGIRSIAVIGGHADAGTLVGGGSSKVLGDEGPSVSVPGTRDGPSVFATMLDQDYNRSSPLAAIRSQLPDAKVSFRDGAYPTDAAIAARAADIAIVFVTQYQTEGFDVPDLSLPHGQDALVEAVAAANPRTIVVLETGGPVAMPWKDRVAGIVEAWYPGARGGEAIAEILFGKVNPSGHLPVTFPQSESQLPRPSLDGLDTVEPNFVGVGAPGQKLDVDYNVEGSDIGYRWFARQGLAPLYPFGHGLSYTTFEHRDLRVRQTREAITASFAIANTGARAGADVAQLYLVSVDGQTRQRLVGFARRELAPGASAKVSLTIDPRLLAEWEDGGWRAAPGRYAFALGHSAAELGPQVEIRLGGYRLDAGGERIREAR